MGWIIVGLYLAVAYLVMMPIFVKVMYANEKLSFYEKDGITPRFKIVDRGRSSSGYRYVRSTYERYDKEDIPNLAWEGLVFGAALYALGWPVALYLVGIEYLARKDEIKEAKDFREQKQQELNLESARAILEKHRKEREREEKQVEVGFDTAFDTLSRTADKMVRS